MVRKRATAEDYKRIQGGEPEIYRDDKGLWHIHHGFLPNAPEVITHINPKSRGTVILSDGKEYDVAKLWEFEGKPCEQRSNKAGRKYLRNRERKG